ncbi:MAG: DUF2382 domain-containing protein, partial [Gemmatimonadaceae bacterium]
DNTSDDTDRHTRDPTGYTMRDTMGSDNQNDAPRVAALGDLGDFQVAEGYPDPRGWDVMDASGQKVGKVHDLIVDTGEMRTRYLDIKLDKDAIGTDDDHDVLIPVGAAQLDDNDDNVMLGSMTETQLAALPRFEHGEITRSYEDSVLAGMPSGVAGAVASGATAAGADYYGTHHFDDKTFFSSRDRNRGTTGADNTTGNTADKERITRSEEELEVGKRQVKAGEVDVHKRVETEHVTKPVTLRREEVTIERRPLRADQTGQNAAQIGGEGEIRIPLTEEEAVIGKRAVVKEELVVKKHAVSENKTVEGDIRKERIDIDRSNERDTGGNMGRDNSSTDRKSR